MQKDHVDKILEQWKRERPELDSSPVAVIGRISRIAGHLEKRLQDNYSRFDLNGGEFDVLASLRRAGAPHQLTPTELYNSLMITSGTMTARLDRLEKAGLIIREPNPVDRRGTLVTLTSRGLELMNRAYPEHLAHEESLLAALSSRERDTLARLLRKLLLSCEQDA